jgi:hypothetical protein
LVPEPEANRIILLIVFSCINFTTRQSQIAFCGFIQQ